MSPSHLTALKAFIAAAKPIDNGLCGGDYFRVTAEDLSDLEEVVREVELEEKQTYEQNNSSSEITTGIIQGA